MHDSFGDERRIADLEHGSRIKVLRAKYAVLRCQVLPVNTGKRGHTAFFHVVGL